MRRGLKLFLLAILCVLAVYPRRWIAVILGGAIAGALGLTTLLISIAVGRGNGPKLGEFSFFWRYVVGGLLVTHLVAGPALYRWRYALIKGLVTTLAVFGLVITLQLSGRNQHTHFGYVFDWFSKHLLLGCPWPKTRQPCATRLGQSDVFTGQVVATLVKGVVGIRRLSVVR